MAELGKAYVQIVPSADGITDGILEAISPAANELGSSMGNSLTAAGTVLKGVGGSLTKTGKAMSAAITAPFLAASGVSLSKFAEVDKTMQLTNATMGNSKEQADLLNKAMEEAAAASVFGMSDAANASLNFARAGLSAEQAASALAPSMNLAAGEGGNLDVVSGGLVATINGFHGSFDDAGKYADVFANACNNSALDVNSLSSSMSVAAPIFSAAGYSVNDAALYMGVLANAGIDANVGANSLKTGLARLVSPAKEGAEMMEQLGISVTNSDGTMKDSVQVQQELHDAFSNLSESEQIAAASAIFGKNQMAPWLALINTAPADVGNLSTALEQEGTTSQMAESMMSGFGGSVERLKSSVDVLITSLGKLAAEYLQPVIDKVIDGVNWFQNLSDSKKKLIIKIAAVVAAAGPLIAIVGTIINVIGSVVLGIGTVMGAIGMITGGAGIAALIPAIGGVIAAAAPLLIGGLIVAGIVAGVIFIVKHWNEIKEKAGEIKDKIVEKWEGLKEDTKEKWEGLKEGIAEKASSAFKSASESFSSLKENAQGLWQDMKDGAGEKLGSMQETASGIFDNVKGLVDFDWSLPEIDTGLVGDAVDWVQGAIDDVKGILDFEWSFPHIDLPHFSWSWNDLGVVSIPSISVNWYAKGGVFEGASMIGVGEAGPEAVVPLSGARMRPFAQAIAEEMDSRGDQEVVELLREYLPALANMKIMLDGRATVGALAPAMDAQMGIISARKLRGN